MSIVLNTPSGGSVTLAEENTASNVVVTVPAVTSTMLTTASNITAQALNGPAFAAILPSPQSIANNTTTKLNFTGESFDTAGAYNAANARFTPQVAGFYQINVSVAFDGGATGTVNSALIQKNGTDQIGQTWFGGASGQYCGAHASAVVYLNGTTDYVEAYGFHNSGSTKNALGGSNSDFSGVLVRAS